MAKYLVKFDFETLIQETNLDELTNSNDRIISDSIDSGVEEVAGYIRHRYDFDQVFRAVIPFTATTAFVVDDRVFWSETAWDSATIYNDTDLVSFTDNIYQANDTTVAGESPSTTPAKWDLRAENNTFYTCILASTGNLPSDATYFTEGDNRNQKIKEVTIDVVLYNIHSRIAPRDIPDVRRTRYDGFGNKKDSGNALDFLEKVQNGRITLDLPVIVEDDGTTSQNTERFSYGTSSNANYNY